MFTALILIIVGIIIALAIGSFWHMPKTPGGKIHMRAIGFDVLSPEEQKKMMEEGKEGMPKAFFGQTILSGLLSSSLVLIMIMSVQGGVDPLFAMGFGVANWLCFMVPVIGGNIIWGNYPKDIVWKKFFSDILYNLVTVVAIVGVAALFV